ncbi:MAG TPA: L-threonylcarbamoyladenylate synthase [Gemmatimonadaceae bacterium]|nr:L-threonylcarbamoyladenylate synthase [Gemmatimonadaceae bacterium]
MAILRVDPAAPNPEAIARAASLLRQGRLVAFPTETVYGLGAHALDTAAVQRIYAAKGRPSYNPLIVHLADAARVRDVVSEWPERAARLAAAFWPGPLTLLLPKRDVVPEAVTAGLPSVAVRVPAHPVALALLRAADIPVAAPSANRSTEISPTTAAHVAKALDDRVDLILDGGPTEVGIESTVLDIGAPMPVILRPGAIGPRELEPVIGRVIFGGHLARAGAPDAEGEIGDAAPEDISPRASPGMMDRHYAPRARVMLFHAAERARLVALVREWSARGERVGGLLLGELDGASTPWLVRMPSAPEAYARRLYDTLHALDDVGCGVIVIERVPESAEWAGVRDRLERAGG